MNIGILGTGAVGETLATALLQKGHHVRMGSRKGGGDKAKAWMKKAGDRASEADFADTAAFGDLLFLCLNGEHALAMVRALPAEATAGKIIVDLTNPLDFSQGMPPRILADYRDRSLGEQIQAALPSAFVVKTLNTVTAALMVDARQVAGGQHLLYLSGNDTDAKNKVGHFLVDNFHWRPDHLLDLGGIETARTTEAVVPLWVLLWQRTGNALFNFQIVK